jgi:K(+)-stimulated pyrophosphate-energized sodium pump
VEKAVRLAFRGGAVAGLTVAGLGLLLVGAGLLVFRDLLALDDWPRALSALGFGAASVALIGRIAGGIYAKGADVGADMVQVAESGSSADDPNNPAAVADGVGDNVGRLAGVSADLFLALLGALVAPMAYALAVLGPGSVQETAVVFPLAVGVVGTLAAGLGTFLVRVRTEAGHAAAFGLAFWFTLAATAAGSVGVSLWLFAGVAQNPAGVGLAAIAGLATALLVGKIVEWHSSDRHKNVKEVARQSQSGPAMVLTSGIGEGMRSAALSTVALAVGIYAAYFAGSWAGLGEGGAIYGVTVAAVGALAVVAMTVTLDAFGPIADNAGGLARSSGLPAETRRSTDVLESAGSSTRATVGGLGTASAVLTGLALLAAFTRVAGMEQISLVRGETTGPLLLGAMLPFLIASLVLTGVGRVASRIVDEVRRQAEEEASGTGPDYRRCVVIATSAALRHMAIPGALALAFPVAVGLFDLVSIGAFLLGLLATGSLLALFMTSSGGAWQGAKMFIETGAFGGTDSDSHQATVIGDAVGDSFKDAAGPAVITVVQTAMILALTLASAFAS